MKTLFNCDEFAFSNMENLNQHHFEYDLEKNFLTPYGIFIPMYSAGIMIVRALRGEISGKDILKTHVCTRLLHINSHGHVWYLCADTDSNDISHEQIVTKHWCMTGFRGNETGNSIAYGHLLKGCETLDKAIARLDRIAYDGFYKPLCFNVKEVAKMLVDKDCTQNFIATRFSDF